MKMWVGMFCCLVAIGAQSQMRWTGAGGTGNWSDPLNWENGVLPGAADVVLLDNSFVAGSYSVRLPDFAVSVVSLEIRPQGSASIALELPLSNVVSSPSGSLLPRAFTTTGTGYTLLLHRGASFLNACGSSSGYSLSIADSIKIENGARYVHRSRTGHAELVQVLSRAPGTESGVFRMENPDAASTISLSGRVFGTLQLSAAATANSLTSYSASGTNAVSIRGNLELEPGVTLAINMADTIRVAGNLQMQQATFNMATGSRSSVLLLKGNWLQTGGTITETNGQQQTGTILLAGNSTQHIQNSGLLADSIAVVVNNASGVALDAPLACAYRLQLLNGALQSSMSNLLTIGAAGRILLDSTKSNAFIDGPLRKLGLSNSYFLFPVGAHGAMRWIALEGATGDITAAYLPGSAYALDGDLSAGLDHVSRMEYWSLNGSSTGAAKVRLSFDPQLSGGVSDLASLRVAALLAGQWTDAGNTATSGAAAASGSVTSEALEGLGSSVGYLTLSSSKSTTNLLPIFWEGLWMEEKNASWRMHWSINARESADRFELELSTDAQKFITAAVIPATAMQTSYEQQLPAGWRFGYCRLRSISSTGVKRVSETLPFGKIIFGDPVISIRQISGSRQLQIQADRQQKCHLQLIDLSGRLLWQSDQVFEKGNTLFALPVQVSGYCLLILYDAFGQRQVQQLFLQ